MALTLKKATKYNAKLRLALIGLTGAGKTFSALNLARYLVPGGTVLVLDSEHGSASKYADIFDFNAEEVQNFDPRNYMKLIKEAENLGVDVLIIDSMSHAWNALVDIANQDKSRGPFGGWDKASPIYRQFIDAIVGCNMHVIATMRQKSDYVIEANDRGKQTPKKVGMKAENREGVDYEFDIVGEFDRDDHSLKITKSRFSAIDQKIFYQPGEELANLLRGWLNTGAPAPEKKPEPPKQQDKPAEKPSQQAAHNAGKVQSGQTAPGAESAASTAPASEKVELGKLLMTGVKNGWKMPQTKKWLCETFALEEKDLQSKLTLDQFNQAMAHVTSGAKP